MSFFVLHHILVFEIDIVYIYTIIQYDPQNLPHSNICVQFHIKGVFLATCIFYFKKSPHLRSHASDVTCVLASVTNFIT